MSGMIDSSQVVAIWRPPFAEGAARKVTFPSGATLADMVVAMDFLPPDFGGRGSILIAGHVIDPTRWRRVTPKPGVRITFHYTLADGGEDEGRRGKSGVLGLVIAVAAIAASVFTLGGGFAFLGTTFGVNTLGAKLLASPMSLTGSLPAEILG